MPKQVAWVKIFCSIDNCGAEIGAKPRELAKVLREHRASAHPGWMPPPDKRRAPRLD